MESQNGNLVHSRSKAACSNIVEGFGVDWQGTLKSRNPENTHNKLISIKEMRNVYFIYEGFVFLESP